MASWVTLVSAISLDGRLAEGDDLALLSLLDKDRGKELRGRSQAMLFEAREVKKRDPELELHEREHQPLIVIVDREGELPVRARLFDAGLPVMLAACSRTPPKRITALKKAHPELTVESFGKESVSLELLLGHLAAHKLRRVLVEGVNPLTRDLLNQGLADELYLTLAPVLVGAGKRHFTFRLTESVELSLEGILQYGNHVVLHYLVK